MIIGWLQCLCLNYWLGQDRKGEDRVIIKVKLIQQEINNLKEVGATVANSLEYID